MKDIQSLVVDSDDGAEGYMTYGIIKGESYRYTTVSVKTILITRTRNPKW